ncbi:hypothetical protein BDV25DRAFT_100597 [Aspergillus avenaceus]|uniref:Uncharacterized protein n=1 Tax=Aspergillus avenaceus TaxID=36643 RepID=A0A5N6TD23_ASPAV|nr:hypothetical protein BDV25DRAFT_100597 [Aspergillus avenaceus]
MLASFLVAHVPQADSGDFCVTTWRRCGLDIVKFFSHQCLQLNHLQRGSAFLHDLHLSLVSFLLFFFFLISFALGRGLYSVGALYHT